MTRPLNMKGAHPAWSMMANLHRPPDVTVAIRTLAAQGLKRHDIAERLGVGVGAVEEALRETETMSMVSA
jgi:DNA-directed RNA polymerase specialized sigma24 family protein